MPQCDAVLRKDWTCKHPIVPSTVGIWLLDSGPQNKQYIWDVVRSIIGHFNRQGLGLADCCQACCRVLCQHSFTQGFWFCSVLKLWSTLTYTIFMGFCRLWPEKYRWWQPGLVKLDENTGEGEMVPIIASSEGSWNCYCVVLVSYFPCVIAQLSYSLGALLFLYIYT